MLFNDIISIQTYQRREYTEIIGDPTGQQKDNPCYMSLGMSRESRLRKFYRNFLKRTYFDAWCQLKNKPCTCQDDNSD
jgi:hypothetical protein